MIPKMERFGIELFQMQYVPFHCDSRAKLVAGGIDQRLTSGDGVPRAS